MDEEEEEEEQGIFKATAITEKQQLSLRWTLGTTARHGGGGGDMEEEEDLSPSLFHRPSPHGDGHARCLLSCVSCDATAEEVRRRPEERASA